MINCQEKQNHEKGDLSLSNNMKKNNDLVNHPDHYMIGKYEVIDFLDEFMKSREGILNHQEIYYITHSFRYLLRYGAKDSRQLDLNKAIWYLNRLKGIIDEGDKRS